jgi:hypothetical protein
MKKQTSLAASLFFVAVSLIINPYLLGLCETANNYCFFDSIANSVGTPLFYISLSLFIILVIASLLPEVFFIAVGRFAIWWIPITLLATFLSPEYGGSGIVSAGRESYSILFSSLFFIISIIIILTKLYKTRGQK